MLSRLREARAALWKPSLGGGPPSIAHAPLLTGAAVAIRLRDVEGAIVFSVVFGGSYVLMILLSVCAINAGASNAQEGMAPYYKLVTPPFVGWHFAMQGLYFVFRR
jgi:hypothetical protein